MFQGFSWESWQVVQHLALEHEGLLCLIWTWVTSSVGGDQPSCLRLFVDLGAALQMGNACEIGVAMVDDLVAVGVRGFYTSVSQACKRVTGANLSSLQLVYQGGLLHL